MDIHSVEKTCVTFGSRGSSISYANAEYPYSTRKTKYGFSHKNIILAHEQKELGIPWLTAGIAASGPSSFSACGQAVLNNS